MLSIVNSLHYHKAEIHQETHKHKNGTNPFYYAAFKTLMGIEECFVCKCIHLGPGKLCFAHVISGDWGDAQVIDCR